jgi:hypothetical protein
MGAPSHLLVRVVEEERVKAAAPWAQHTGQHAAVHGGGAANLVLPTGVQIPQRLVPRVLVNAVPPKVGVQLLDLCVRAGC